MKRFSLAYSLDWLIALCAFGGILGVLQTFIVGKHYIIPTVLLVLTVLLGNLAWFGLNDAKWAKYINVWIGIIVTSHLFFAVFWAKTPREILGNAFEPVTIILTVTMFLLTAYYARLNTLFKPNQIGHVPLCAISILQFS